ncbi:proline iminopeptidase-family hydrolase [Sciscionella sediminilitoris]|uniref:proline iminopeptidase-family hydrolase n=1 Tax=Sciscionella sediminilitoris TaxID=1445613 RepID=UPI0009EC86CB|nr:proline iminopeptidase-family hydrolase [Sciscionella sp. SE31]
MSPTQSSVPAATSEGRVAGPRGQTWYRVTGDLAVSRERGLTPLVILHGGPGVPHDYLLRMARIAETGRAVVHYDQLGCGRSTHLPEADAGTWSVELFLEELDRLLAALRIEDDHLVLGQSWGGMLAAEHAIRRPPGLRGVVLANSPASVPLWSHGVDRLRQALPAGVQAVLDRHEAAGTTSSAEYKEAETAFYDRHVLRMTPYPAEVTSSFALLEEDPTVYHTMWGPNEFSAEGSLSGWSVVDRLDRIGAPVLVLRGEHDEATAECVTPLVDGIAGARLRVFAESSHMPHIEEEAAFRAVVEEFLADCDARPQRPAAVTSR